MEREDHASTKKTGEHQTAAALLKADILGFAEVRWLDSGNVISDDYTLIYAEHKKEHKYGVD